MASTAAAAYAPARVTGGVVSFGSRPQKMANKTVYVRGLNGFGGLKAYNSVVALGMPVCTEQCFANMVSSIKASSGRSGGGALSSKCNKIGEIFQIAAILNGLTLVGVAIGFVLLRIEASVEESES